MPLVSLSIPCSFNHDDVALKNLVRYFLHQPQDEEEDAEKLRKLQKKSECLGWRWLTEYWACKWYTDITDRKNTQVFSNNDDGLINKKLPKELLLSTDFPFHQ
ncbi:hypothetical protein STEG23_025739 [Scotinomys teguina]